MALTLGVLGALAAGALIVKELRTGWLASMTIQVVLEEGANGERVALEWGADDAVASAVYIDADSASADMERELGEPFMDFLGASPLPAVVELRLNPEWIGQAGSQGLADKAAVWASQEGVTRVAYPQRGVGASRTRVCRLDGAVVRVAGRVHDRGGGADFQCRATECVRPASIDPQHGPRGAPPSPDSQTLHRRSYGLRSGRGDAGLFWRCGLFGALKPFLSVLQSWGPEQLLSLLVLQLAMGMLMTGLSARWAVAKQPRCAVGQAREPRAHDRA